MLNRTIDVAIGICGKARSGKSTAADMLQSILLQNYDVISAVIPLAEKLKQECSDATKIPLELFDDPAIKETLRPFMQWWGTEYRKNPLLGETHHQLYWVQKVAETFNSLPEDYTAIIVPDIRYDFEAEFIQNCDAKVKLILNLESMNFTSTSHSSHSSEAGVNSDLITHRIVNNHEDGLDVLKSQLGLLLETQLRGKV